MSISFLGPLTRAWERARAMLFAPFRLEFWLSLGFAAFLSEWMTGGWGGTGWQRRFAWHERGPWHTGGPWHMPDLWPAVLLGPLLVAVITVIVIIAIAMLWVGSRGRFVFLDDVLRGRSAITEPWNRCAALGQSLFLWQLGLWVVTFLVVGAVLFAFTGTAVVAWLFSRSPLVLAPSLVLGVLLAGMLGLVFAFIQVLLTDFAVPLMLRDGISTSAAWRRFLPLLRARLGTFILYGLFVLVLNMLLAAVVVTVGVATCCVGLLLVALPYVGQVVLLPAYVTLRGLGPEFLRQFGAEFDVRVTVPEDPVTAAAPTAPPAAPPPPAQGPQA